MNTMVKAEVTLARLYNWLGLNYKKTGEYPMAAKKAFAMCRHHMSEARLEKSRAC